MTSTSQAAATALAAALATAAAAVRPNSRTGDSDIDLDQEEEEVTTAEFELPLAASASLFECAAEGDVARLHRLLDDRSARVDDVDVDGFSALMIAAAEGHRAVVLELLARGADVAVRTLELRSSALHFAAKNGDAEVVHAICEKDPRYVDCLNINADTPLIWACIEGRAECVRVLLAHNADVSAVNQFGATTLICAVMIGEDPDEDESDDARAEIIKMLLATNPKLVNFQDREGSTAMHLAAACGYLQCVKTLLEHGADITLRNAIGQTPLEEAEQTGLVESDVCVDHLRTIWHKLEEEAAARMLSMLEMEEASARSSRTQSGAASKSGVPSSSSNAAAVNGGSKKNKKKSKKLKRKAAKHQTQGSGDVGSAGSADAAAGAVSLDHAAAGISEPGSSGESSDDEEVSAKTNDDERIAKVAAASRPATGTGGGDESAQGDAAAAGSLDDSAAVAGVWTTVGKRANRSAAAVVETSLPDGDPPAAALTQPRTTSVPSTAPGAHHPGSASSAASSKAPPQKAPPIRRKTLKQQRQNHDTSARSSSSAGSTTVATGALTGSSASVASTASSAQPPSAPPSAAPSSFGSRIGATHPAVPYSSTPIFNSSSGSSSSFGSPFVGRAHERIRTHVGFPSSWRSASPGFGPSVNGSNSSSSVTRSLLWKHAHRVPGSQRAAAEAMSKWVARFHLPDDRVAEAIACLACGICGELAQDNIQCNVSVNGSGCAQLYCCACVERVAGSVSLAGGLSLQCVKCHQLMTKDEMRMNHFAQAQAAALQQSRGGSALFPPDNADARLTMEEMRHALETSIPTAATVELNPFFLAPGSDLAALSNGQLEILEQAHQVALTQIMETRIANARAQERMQIEEWMKTQRDILHYSAMVANAGAHHP